MHENRSDELDQQGVCSQGEAGILKHSPRNSAPRSSWESRFMKGHWESGYGQGLLVHCLMPFTLHRMSFQNKWFTKHKKQLYFESLGKYESKSQGATTSQLLGWLDSKKRWKRASVGEHVEKAWNNHTHCWWDCQMTWHPYEDDSSLPN